MDNSGEIFQRLSSYEKHKTMGPLNLFLFVSTVCPLECTFCARRVYLDIKKGRASDIDRFAAISLFGLDSGTLSNVKAKLMVGYEEIADEITKKKESRDASSSIDKIIMGSEPLDYSKYKGCARIIEESPRDDRVPLYAYSIIKIREKLSGDMNHRMPLDVYIRVVREAAALGVRNIYLTGAIGEPLSDRDFLMEIMKEIGKHDIVGHLTTNGYYGDTEIAEQLVEMEWPSVIISIDGAKAETHDRLRGKNGSFGRAFAFLKQLKETKLASKKAFPRISVSAVVNRLNFCEIIDHFELMEGAGADSVYYSPIRIYTKEAGRKLVMRDGDETELKRLIEKERLRWEDSGVKNNINSLMDWEKGYGYGPCVHPKKGIFEDVVHFTNWNGTPHNDKVIPDRIKCTEPWTSMAVDANGSVVQCCVSSIPLINMNVNDHSLGEIWHSERYGHLRDHFIEGKLPYECKNHCLPPIMNDQKNLIEVFLETKKVSDFKKKGPMASTIERVDNEITRLTGIDIKRKIKDIRDKISKT